MMTRPATMETLRAIVDNKVAVRLRFEDNTRTVLCDHWTASLVCQVFDRCSKPQQEIIALRVRTSDGFDRVRQACHKVVGACI